MKTEQEYTNIILVDLEGIYKVNTVNQVKQTIDSSVLLRLAIGCLTVFVGPGKYAMSDILIKNSSRSSVSPTVRNSSDLLDCSG